MKNTNSRNFVQALQAVANTVEQTYHNEKTINSLTHKVTNSKAEIKKALGRKDSMTFKNQDGNEFLVSRIRDADIALDLAKAKETLTSEQFKGITDQKLLITDYHELISLLKQYGVPPAKFKRFVQAEYEINSDKLDHMLEIGEINIAEAQQFATATYEDEIKIRKVK